MFSRCKCPVYHSFGVHSVCSEFALISYHGIVDICAVELLLTTVVKFIMNGVYSGNICKIFPV